MKTGYGGGFSRKASENVISSDSTKNIHVRTKSGLNQRIIDKFYMPYIEKKYYQIALNVNIGNIKKDTRQSANDNFLLDKKKVDIGKMKHRMILYNNPSKNNLF